MISRKQSDWLIPVGIALIIIAAGLLLWFLMRGQTTVTGGYPENTSSVSLSCDGGNLEYPFFSYDKSNEKHITVNMVFNEKQLSSILLIYELTYGDVEQVAKSETINRATMNKAIGNIDAASMLNPNFSSTGASLRMSLYASGDEAIKAKSFFLITDSLRDIDDYARNYTAQGFECSKKN